MAGAKRTETGWDKERERSAKNQRKIAAEGRDIGSPPEVVNPRRKKRCERSLKSFLQTYFPETFILGWSDDHAVVIGKLETAIREGGQFGVAMPRGSGKSVIVERSALWAVLYGYREFVLLIGSDERAAGDMLEAIQGELVDNELLFEDFPEACYPIRCLENIANRCSGQTCQGVPTNMTWNAKKLVLPTMKGAKCSGSIISVRGLTGGFRGMKHLKADGRSVRPSMVILDDPQTDESANSPSQCETRERIINGAVLGLGGPKTKIAAVMPCTVIADGDMADKILDRKRNPQWHGERTAFMRTMAATDSEAHKLWLEYCDIRKRCQREDRPNDEATAFYRKNRTAMDAGYEPSWKWRFNSDELSAVQNAWNVICDRGEAAFRAEYQNQPIKVQLSTEYKLSADTIAGRLNRCERGVIPTGLSRLTGFIDVQGKALFWLVAAWSDNFTGAIVDYGAWPDQGLSYYTLSQVKRTIQQAFPGQGTEASMYAALQACVSQIVRREWQTDSGATMRIERLMIDANWPESTDTVKLFCRQSPDGGVLLPSHGRYFGASAPDLNERGVQPGDRIGTNWRIPAPDRARPVRHALWSTNYWKTFVAARLRSGMGSPGALTLFGDRPEPHRMLADHLTAEYATLVSARGREVYEWRLYPGRDNHWWDCLVGSAVAASIAGCQLLDTRPTVQRPAGPRVRVNMPTASGDRPFFISGR